MDDGVLRQRRNLMVISCVLWLLCYAGAKETPAISAGGLSLTLTRPEGIYAGLWIAFAYFLYRYCVYALAHQYNVTQRVRELVTAAKRRVLLKAMQDTVGSPFVTVGELDVEALLRSDGPHRLKIQPSDGKHLQRFEEFTFSATVRRRAQVATVLVGVRLALLDPLASDYIYPLVLAFFVLWYAGLGDWAGSFPALMSP